MENKNITCKNCGSAFIYVRIKDREAVCRKCGHIQKLKEEKKDANSS